MPGRKTKMERGIKNDGRSGASDHNVGQDDQESTLGKRHWDKSLRR